MKINLSLSRFLESIAWKMFPWANATVRLETGVQFPVRDKSDFNVVNEILQCGIYDRFLDALPPVRTVLDLGCHHGYFALLLEHRRRKAHRDGEGSHYVLVDANPDMVEQARQALALNALADAEVRQGIVAPASGTAEFYISAATETSSLSRPSRYRRRLTAQPLDLTALVKTSFPGGIDLVKCDIEGAEVALIRDWGEALAGANALILEWHNVEWTWDQALKELEKLGFDLQDSFSLNGGYSNALFKRRSP
jgi:FkbM family methyltransferase